MKKAVFPGSFDPFTKGHQEIVERATELFDEIIIAFGINESKAYLFDTDSRVNHVKEIFKNDKRISVTKYTGLTVDFCKETGAQFILRGIRNTVDLEYERAIAEMNKSMSGIESVFLIADPAKAAISSSIVREIYKNGANIASYVTNSNELVINKND